MTNPKYLTDIHKYLDRIPYGDVQLQIKRRNNKVVEIQTNSVETTRPESSDEAVAEVTQLLKALESIEFSGNITFTVNYKGGQIKEIGHYNTKQTNYQGN